MDIILSYFAGILTLINPCVLPVLPIALASSLSGHKYGPLAMAAGMSATFTILGVTVASIGPSIGLSVERVSQIGAVIMIGFGLVLLVPKLNTGFALATAGLSNSANTNMGRLGNNRLFDQFFGGALLGAVWAPCIGPTIGGAISLASQGQSLIYSTLVMLTFSLGISTVMIALAYGAREAIKSRQEKMRSLADKAKPIMGIVFISVGLLTLFNIFPMIESIILDAMPFWLQDLSVAI